MTRNGDPRLTLSYGLETIQSNPVTTDGTPPPACPFHPSYCPRNHHGHAQTPARPNFIPDIAPRSGASLSQFRIPYPRVFRPDMSPPQHVILYRILFGLLPGVLTVDMPARPRIGE
jgi:hypothetical protein